jgi:hypothetical protein
VYHPDFRPMGTDMLSLLALYTIRDLKSSTPEEIREKIKDDAGFDIRSEKFFDTKILRKIEVEGWIEYKGNIIECTKEGKKHCYDISQKYDEIKSLAINYFKKKLRSTYPGFQEPKEWKSIEESFLKCLRYISQIDLDNRLHHSDERGNCKKCFKEKKGIDEESKKYCVEFCNQLFFHQIRPEEIREMLSILHYDTVVQYMLEDPEVRDFFRQDIHEKRICLDTNALIAAVTSHDPNHRRMRFLLTHLKDLRDNKINVFWFSETEKEFFDVFEASYRLVDALESYPISELNRIVDSPGITSFVRDYIKNGWHDLDTYKNYIYRRYEVLNKLCRETIDNETRRNSSYVQENAEMYLFNWNKVPGSDNEKLLKYLEENRKAIWMESAKIHKTEDGKIIHVTKEGNSFEIRIDENEEKATVNINGRRIDCLKVKHDNGELNIYIEIRKRVENCLKNHGKYGAALKHDATILTRLINLRLQDNKQDDPISDYWLVTFDRSMIKYTLQISEETGEQPICIGMRALQLLMEPYITVGVIETVAPHDIPIAFRGVKRLDDEDLDKISTFYNALESHKRFAEYLENENKEEFSIGDHK